jgi:hypothetical protein
MEVLFMKRETLFLKAVVILLGLPVLALCIFWVPEVPNFMAELYPEATYLQYLVVIGFYATAIPYYIALYQTFKLLNYIDQNKAFSDLSVKALQNIKYCGTAISMLYVLVMPLFYVVAELEDAPGAFIIGMVPMFASIVIVVFAAVLQKLLKNAIEIKSELDLTI